MPNIDDLPPHLRDLERNRPAPPALQIPLELPREHPEMPAAPLDKDERPVDPFLRRS